MVNTSQHPPGYGTVIHDRKGESIEENFRMERGRVCTWMPVCAGWVTRACVCAEFVKPASVQVHDRKIEVRVH